MTKILRLSSLSERNASDILQTCTYVPSHEDLRPGSGDGIVPILEEVIGAVWEKRSDEKHRTDEEGAT